MRAKKRSSGLVVLVVVLAVILLGLCVTAFVLERELQLSVPQQTEPTEAPSEPETIPPETEPAEFTVPTLPRGGTLGTIQTFAEPYGLSITDYPNNLVQLMERNPETEEFVLNYPLEHDLEHEIDLSEYADAEEMPLFMQWDRRWGYMIYGADVAALTACGPTCLAMVVFYLTGDTELTPDKVITYAGEHGYYTPGRGTAWNFIPEGGRHFGLSVSSITTDQIVSNLEAGKPVICAVGPGDFTTSGHFIVLASYQDGYIKINDPNSKANSEKQWTLSDIRSQIRAVWALSYSQ